MFDEKTRRELLKGGIGAAIVAAVPTIGMGTEPTAPRPIQGGTNPVVKGPAEIDARPGSTLRATIYPSVLDKEGDTYEVRVFELTIGTDAEGKFSVAVKHEGIEGIEGKQFRDTVTVKDLSTPLVSLIKLDYIPANMTNRVIVVAAFNALRSGLTTVQLKKA